jgi:vacuolar-type H+-ATPase subunit E/Vma4
LETAIGKADSYEWERIQSDYEAKAKAINDRINEQVKAAHAEVQAFLDSREQEKQERYLSLAKKVIFNAKRRIHASGRKPTKEDIDLIRRTLLANNLSKEQADALLKQEFQSFFERNN